MHAAGAHAGLLALGLALGCRPSAAVADPPAATEPGPTPAATDRQATADEAARTAHDAALRAGLACPADSPQYRAARDELQALDAAIEALPDLDDPAPLLRRLEAVLHDPCLGLARIHAIPLRAGNGLALRQWRERGGITWLADALRFSKDQHRTVVEHGAVVTLPPTMPSTLSRQTHPKHPLSPWLCDLGDAACTASTAGWRERAERATAPDPGYRDDFTRANDSRRCGERVADDEPEHRYERWAHCMYSAEGSGLDFPLGGISAPRAGWLLVEGRRGHYAFCDELHAYELETGAAHVVRSCSGLVLDHQAGVDEEAIANGRRLEVQRGTVPRDNVRELVWMLLVADHVRSPAVREFARVLPPEGIELPTTPKPLGVAEPMRIGGSNQTTLRWSFVPPTGPALDGELSWPPGYNTAPLEHAAKLLSVAEQGLAPGCAPKPLPATLPLPGTLTGVSPIDASPEALDDTHAVLRGALRDEARCDRGR